MVLISNNLISLHKVWLKFRPSVGYFHQVFGVCVVNFFNDFSYFFIISHWKRSVPFIWTNLISLHPRMICAMFGEIIPVVLEQQIFFYIFNITCPVVLEKMVIMWKVYDNNNNENNNDRQILIRRWFFNFVNVSLLFCYYLPWKRVGTLFTQICFVPKLVEIGTVVLLKKIFKFCQSIFTIL